MAGLSLQMNVVVDDKEKVRMSDEDRRKAVEIAGEWNKQLALWATGSVVLSLGFIKDFLVNNPPTPQWRYELYISWFVLLLSVLSGHFAFGAPLTKVDGPGWQLRVTPQMRKYSLIQVILFIGGLVGVTLFAATHLPRPAPVQTPPSTQITTPTIGPPVQPSSTH
jgi:hypothetical protein